MSFQSVHSVFKGLRALVLATTAATACSTDLPDYTPPPVLEIGESRDIELRFTRFDVTNFEQTFTKADLAALPRDVQDRLWLLDLDISGGAAAPMLLDNALEKIRGLDPSTLSRPARNMQALLEMTPDNADLSGSSFESLLSLAPILGISAQKVLADMLLINVEDTFLSTESIADTILSNVIASHPNANVRRGPVTPNNPEGLYPVSPGSLPVTLADAASDFATLSRRFGETYIDGVYHPGFIAGDVKGRVFDDNFSLTVRANANALPYKGVDLTNASTASVNSTASQIMDLFDFTDPNWIRIEGLLPGQPVIDSLTFRIVEDPRFIAGGRSPNPSPYGDSPVWRLPAWTIERILVDATIANFQHLDSYIRYDLPNSTQPAMELTIDQGWASIETVGGLGTPPLPQYVWDLLLEIGQIRLHDGGLAEGDANVEFTLSDIPVGLDSHEIEAMIRRNIEADPSALLDVAVGLLDNTRGEADFYYYRPAPSNAADVQGDYLYFVAPQDIGLDEHGTPVRPYAYTRPGFFSDRNLSQKLSTTIEIDGDVSHEKLKLEVGMSFYCEGDVGRTYRLEVLPKKSERILRLKITRVN